MLTEDWRGDLALGRLSSVYCCSSPEKVNFLLIKDGSSCVSPSRV